MHLACARSTKSSHLSSTAAHALCAVQIHFEESLGQAVVQRSTLLISGEQSFRYFTGDLHASPFQNTRPKFFILPFKVDPCLVVVQGQDVGLRRYGWIKDIRTWPTPRPEDDGVSLVADALKSFLGKERTVGA